MNTDIKLINKSSIENLYKKRMDEGVMVTGPEMCDVVNPVLRGQSGKLSDEQLFNAVVASHTVGRENVIAGKKVKEYGSPYDTPRFCESKNKIMSVREMLKDGIFTDASMASNTLIPDWQTLWDALRIDISIKKAARDTVRQNFYNIVDMPASAKVFKPTEFFPYGVVFEENNGEGQAVVQGETLAGQVETIEHLIYAAGFTWTLLAELFDKSLDPERITDAVMLGYNSKRDDLSISPIIDFSYSGTQQTAADTTGSGRQELLYNTLEDAIDDLGEREDPVTERKIDVTDLKILASPLDARHIARVAGGFSRDSVEGGVSGPKNLPMITEISTVVSYDGESIPLRAKTITYAGVTNGTAYLVKMNRYMNVGIKRNLQVEVDQTPDVKTLAREERSWYFVEGQQTTGLASFVQEITLPTW